jgi:hypothetical protein
VTTEQGRERNGAREQIAIGRPLRRLTHICATALLALSCVLPGAQAQTPGRETAVLEGVNMAVVMPVDLAANPANAECGLTEPLVAEAIQLTVQAAGLRTELLAQAQPFTTITPGVYLIPTIATLRDSSSLCVTWLSLKAQSAHTLTLPSTQQRKTVQILYWDRGMLLSTPRGGHAGAVAAGLRQLASDFGEQWRRDQR